MSKASLQWFVAQTRPRREKKLKQACEQQGIRTTLPCYRSDHSYRGKRVSFQKPLFPGYLFLELAPECQQTVRQSAHLARLLRVSDQDTFKRQLTDILEALKTESEIFLAPQIGPGTRVRVKTGMLRGLEGSVEQRYGMCTILLRLDFIGKAAAVKLHPDALESI